MSPHSLFFSLSHIFTRLKRGKENSDPLLKTNEQSHSHTHRRPEEAEGNEGVEKEGAGDKRKQNKRRTEKKINSGKMNGEQV